MTVYDALPKQIRDLLDDVATAHPVGSLICDWEDGNGESMVDSGQKALDILKSQTFKGKKK